MRKVLLTYCSFVVACFLVIAAFITATTYIQLTVAILLYPLMVFFAYKAFPRKASKAPQKPQTVDQQTAKPVEKVEPVDTGTVGIADIDKRVFLKLIGGMGVALFLFSIFNKRAEGLFFKGLPSSGSVSLQDTKGNKIDPAKDQPMDGYRISEVFDTEAFTFYGFTNKDGAWIIMRGDEESGSFRYASGNSNFPDGWAKKENLKYDYFSNIF